MAGRPAQKAPIPVTMLSGFLGSGKTTLLRSLLQQNEQKIACIVNDVASVNIDAKLIRNDRTNANKQTYTSTKDLAETVELENGCACCSIQDELFMSFESLLAVADQKGTTYDRFVLENSGVAEPQNLREAFNEAILDGHPVMSRIFLDNMVTIVDSGTFITDYSSCTALAGRPDLGEGGTLRPVVDLLVEQIECADFVLLNKKDTITEEQAESLINIVKQLNPIAKVEACEHGKVDIQKVFSAETRGLVAQLNTEGQHRSAVTAARRAAAELEQQKKDQQEHQHHDHEHKEEHAHPHDEKHSDHGHKHDDHTHCDHDHGHCDHKHEDHGDHKHDHKEHDHGHSHGHAHHHDHGHEKDASDHHDHKHDHGHDHHGHDHHGHSHSHSERQTTTAATRFGIFSFVYSRRRPFHPQRLRELVLKWLPVANNAALDGGSQGVGDSPIKAVLRSKGFMWMSYSHSSAFYWSHAGQHFDIRDEGDWWAIVPDSDWPTDLGQRRVILSDFDYDSDFGDRRQEIVFIGAGMDEKAICEKLDAALLTDEEMGAYKQRYAAVRDPEHPEVILEMKKRQKVTA